MSNGKRAYDSRGAQARRLTDLTTAFLRDFSEPDEAAVMLARTAALASMRLEVIETKAVTGQEINDLALVRLGGQLARALAALRALKPKAQPAGERPGEALRRHLAAMAERPPPSA